MVLDIDAYLGRIGTVAGPVNATTLHRLHRAHVMTLTFENLDVALGRDISIELGDIQEKLVKRRRGGYCYEHNLLFAAVLEQLGFTVTRLAGRVALGEDEVLPRTHVVLRVDTVDGEFLADVGFGANGLTEALPWCDGAVSPQNGWRFVMRLLPSQEWSLARWHEGSWLTLYRLGSDRMHLIDFVVGNHYVSTHPRSKAVGRIMVQRQTPTCRWILEGCELSKHQPGSPVERVSVTRTDLRTVLTEIFDLELSDDELSALGSVLDRLRSDRQ